MWTLRRTLATLVPLEPRKQPVLRKSRSSRWMLGRGRLNVTEERSRRYLKVWAGRTNDNRHEIGGGVANLDSRHVFPKKGFQEELRIAAESGGQARNYPFKPGTVLVRTTYTVFHRCLSWCTHAGFRLCRSLPANIALREPSVCKRLLRLYACSDLTPLSSNPRTHHSSTSAQHIAGDYPDTM